MIRAAGGVPRRAQRRAPNGIHAARTKIQNLGNGTTLAAYCFGCIETDPISRVSLVTQLTCRLYPLGVRV
jgi:hypothetical protein